MTTSDKPKTLRPRDAATLVLVRRRRGGAEVLLGQRHGGHAFMPNRYVFPGGRVDPYDSHVKPATPLRADVAVRLARHCSPARARALAIAAVRETFEETGLMLAQPAPNGAPGTGREPWDAFHARGLAPALDALDYIFHAITPPGRPRRFNARFFMADAEALTGEIAGSGELGDIKWLAIRDALELHIPNITQHVLVEAERLLKSPPAPDPDRPVPFYRTLRGRHHFGHD